MNKKLLLRLGALFLFVLLISAAVIYFTFDIRTLDYLTMFEPKCIFLALGCLAIGLLFDGLRLITLANITEERLTLRQIVNVVLSNYFLALVSPGASGGAIAQVMFMRKAGVPVAKSTVVILVRTIMSIIFLILLVPLVLHFDQDIVEWMPASVITMVSVAFVSLPLIAIFLMRTRYPEKIIFYCTRKLSYTTRRNCYIWYQQFKKAAIVMGKNPLMVLRAFIESGLSLLFIYATVPAYMTGLNIDFDLAQVMGRMIFRPHPVVVVLPRQASSCFSPIFFPVVWREFWPFYGALRRNICPSCWVQWLPLGPLAVMLSMCPRSRPKPRWFHLKIRLNSA